ncbi:unnamed protein product [Paramecium pentaurelia]|uniref:P-loop containing nucleoside triphosphate hydrolase n=1 Tax=Paramecium pentaurelia TaxID=43138 RepID=A0A8S1XDI0_9CILI|nr:unnamed protein product [Paramecium pentaurelia]
MQIQQQNSFNIVIIGGEGAGKTTLFNQLVAGKFNEHYYKTIGIDVEIKQISIEDIQYNLQFYDTSGQERFQTICSQYYRRAQCCVIVYDLTDPYDITTIKNWMRSFSIQCGLDPKHKFPFVIVGTRMDKLNQEQNINLDLSDNIQSFQVSLKDDNSVQQILQAIINVTVLKQHAIIKHQEKAKSNPICQKFTNSINRDIEKLNEIMTLIQSSKEKIVETYDQLINNVGQWQNQLKDLKCFYNSPTFLDKIEQSNFSQELFIEQEQITFNDKIEKVNQSYSEKSENGLKDINNLIEEASKLKIQFNN